jgi:hypothetical protein
MRKGKKMHADGASSPASYSPCHPSLIGEIHGAVLNHWCKIFFLAPDIDCERKISNSGVADTFEAVFSPPPFSSILSHSA